MNYIDVVLAIFLLIAAFSGFRKGFIIEVASLVALILGIWGAIKFSHFMAGFLSGQFDFHANYLGVAAFVGERLESVIGKEMAEKILSAKEESGTSMPRREGMKGFYGEPSEGKPGEIVETKIVDKDTPSIFNRYNQKKKELAEKENRSFFNTPSKSKILTPL